MFFGAWLAFTNEQMKLHQNTEFDSTMSTYGTFSASIYRYIDPLLSFAFPKV